MRCVSFFLVILAVAGTSSVRGQQPEFREVREERRDDRQEGREERRDDRREARGDRGGDHELLRLALIAALRDGDFGDRQSVREERRDDRQEGREERRDDRREARGDQGGDHELLRLAALAALRDRDFGDRQSVREERRDDRQEGREERRDDRREARGDQGGDHELLRLAALAALRDGNFGDRQSVREERREDRREARRSGRRPRIVTPCAYCGASRRGFWRPAVGQRGTSRRSTRGREERRDDRREARGDQGGDHELLRLAALAALRDGDFGDRQSVREERREDRQEGARNVGTSDESCSATAIRIETTAGRWRVSVRPRNGVRSLIERACQAVQLPDNISSTRG